MASQPPRPPQPPLPPQGNGAAPPIQGFAPPVRFTAPFPPAIAETSALSAGSAHPPSVMSFIPQPYGAAPAAPLAYGSYGQMAPPVPSFVPTPHMQFVPPPMPMPFQQSVYGSPLVQPVPATPLMHQHHHNQLQQQPMHSTGAFLAPTREFHDDVDMDARKKKKKKKKRESYEGVALVENDDDHLEPRYHKYSTRTQRTGERKSYAVDALSDVLDEDEEERTTEAAIEESVRSAAAATAAATASSSSTTATFAPASSASGTVTENGADGSSALDPGLNSEVVDDELAGLDRYTVVSKIGRVFSHMRGKAVRARAVEVDLMSDDEEEEEEKAKSETKSETETETKSETGIKSETETKPNEEEGEGVAKMEDIEGSEETNKDEEDGGKADSEEEEEEDVVIDWCPVDPYVRGYLVNRLLRLHETDNSLPDTDTMYLIQWEGASHLHDSWRSYAELKELGVTGMRKLDNYIKSVRERVQWRTEVATPEEIDMQDIQTAMQFELMMSQSKLERVIRAEVIDPKLFALREQAFACAEEEEQRREERRQERLAMGRGNADDDDFDDDEGEVTTTGVRRVVAVDDDSLLAPTGEIKESALNDYGSFVYLCKWQGIPYAEATWEYGPHIARSENKRHVLEYISRVRSRTKPDADCQALMRRPTFRPLQIQPQWLGNFVEAPKEGQEASATSTLTAAQSVAVSAFDSLMADGSDREMQTLRDYQLDGINWLTLNWCSGRGAILADEMGLGKTVQTVGFISTLMWQYAVYGPFLVVVPLSTISAWAREFHKWAPAINVITYIGDSASRERIRETEWYSDMRHRQIKFNVLLTTYETTLADAVYLSEIRSKRGWACMCLDEAHRLKNAEGRTHQVLTEIKCNHRMLITGTPLQNTLKELWSLLHFLAPARYAEWEEFEQEHNDLKARDDVSRLHTELQPYLLRRVKKDVEKSMPSKTERILRIEMSVEQRRYYKAILTRNYRALKEASTGKGRPMASLVNIVMELKKCCNHPYLVDGRMRTGEVTDADLMLDAVVNASGKMVLLDKLLVRLHEQGHRVLVFSQMVRMLDILAEYLHKRGWPFQRLDGGVGNEARRQAVDHFNKEGSSDFLFLLSTRAGGLGINLATADTVIIFDSDWNPQNDLQAAARAHRIGQKRTVNIYRLVTKSSVEEEILQRAKNKMVLDHLVIQRMDTSGRTVLGDSFAQKSGGMHGKGAADAAAAGKQPFNTEELDAILKFGAMDLFKQDDGDGEGETNFAASRMELDLDEVLSRAEIGGGEGEQGEEGEEGDSELLSQFHVSSVSFKDANVNWDEIIPDSARDRLKAEEADEAARNELRRKRIMGEREDFDGVEKSKSRRSKGKKGALAKGGDAQKMNEDEEEEEEDEEGGEEAEGVDESEDYVGQITGAGARKARRKRISAIAMSDVLAISESVHDRPRKNVDEDLVNHPTESGFAPKDIRKFVARWRQFGDIANQLERIVLSAEMFECDLPSDDDDEINFAKSTRVVTLEKDGQSAKILAQELKNGCEWAVEEAIQAKKEAEAKGASPEDIPDPSRVRFMLNGVGMFAEEMILRDEDMRQLRVRMRSCEGGFFSIPKEVRQQMPAPKKWAFHWSSEDDAALLIGVDMYGFGGWDQVKADEDLGIARRILNKNKLKAPQRAHLGSRVEKLFKLLRQEKGWRLGEEKGGPPGATVSAMSAVGAGRSGSGTVRPLETTTKLVAHEFAYEGRKKEKRKREEVEGEEEKGEEGEEGAKKVKTERAEEEDVHDEKVVEPPVAPGATGVVVATASAPVAPVPVVKEKAKESAVEDPTAAAERALMMQFGWT